MHPETREMIIGMTEQGVKHLKIDPDSSSPSITDVTGASDCYSALLTLGSRL